MSFARWKATKGKIDVSGEVCKETEIGYLHSFVAKIKKTKYLNQISEISNLNQDQTPSKFGSGCNETHASNGSKHVSTEEAADKRLIKITFIMEDFLPAKIIYGGKTTKSIQKMERTKVTRKNL